MAERAVFELTFNTNVGEKFNMTVPYADTELNGTGVQTAMNAMIANGSIVTDQGIPVEIAGAKRTLYTTTPITL
jgi:hypothetical protein